MKELIIELIQSTKERLTGKFFGPFAVSFLVFNWRLTLIVFFSDLSGEETVAIIEANSYFEFWPNVGVPLLVGAFYNIFTTYLNALIEWASLIPLKKRIDVKADLKNASLTKNLAHARTEFQIQDTRAGNVTLQELNQRNENLVLELEAILKDKETLGEKIKAREDQNSHLLLRIHAFEELSKEQLKKINIPIDLADPLQIQIVEFLIGRLSQDPLLVEIPPNIIPFALNQGLLHVSEKGFELSEKGSNIHQRFN